MKVMLNYALTYGSNLSDVLVAKLTCFYNRIILQEATRLIILLPESEQLARADLHKNMFDEITVNKFDPTNTQFWSAKKLYQYLFFTSSLNGEYAHVYIGHGKIAQAFDSPEQEDIVVANAIQNEELIQYVNKQLEAHCDLPLLEFGDLVLYDCSVFFISDNLRADFQNLLKQVATTYPEYVDDECASAILSCIIAHLKKSKQFSVKSLKQNVIDISHSGLIEDFYTLI